MGRTADRQPRATKPKAAKHQRRSGESAVGARIRRIRRDSNLTQSQLAKKANVNQGYLSSIERGDRVAGAGMIRAIAVALGVPEAVLLGAGEGHDAPQALETRELPLFGTIPNGPPGESQEQLEMFPVLRHLWRPDRYCLRCEFDSMEPTLKRGDIILVDYRPGVEPEFVQGRICACLVDGRPTLKRVSVERRSEDRMVILRGDNPSTPPSVIDGSREFTIQGVAVCLVSREL
ncbi:MAG: XRE family transcriptional regulator [Planctomycetota bacterium]